MTDKDIRIANAAVALKLLADDLLITVNVLHDIAAGRSSSDLSRINRLFKYYKEEEKEVREAIKSYIEALKAE